MIAGKNVMVGDDDKEGGISRESFLKYLSLPEIRLLLPDDMERIQAKTNKMF